MTEIETDTDPKHFTEAVIALGEKRPVLTTRAIFNDRGIKIIEQGVEVNAGLYDRLMAHQLSRPLEESVASTPVVTGVVLRGQAEQAMDEIPFFKRIGSDSQTRNLLLNTLAELRFPNAMAFQLTLACEMRPTLFRRAILMSLFAAWMTQGPLMSRFDISLAAAAGLLQDIGMLHLDPALLTPESVINDKQQRQLYSHPLVAAVLIERHHAYPREMLRAVREQHEFLDGSGYPAHLSAEAISPLGRILSLAELVSSMLMSEHTAPELRLWVQLRMNKHRYDPQLLDRVLQHLEPQALQHSKSMAVMADPVGQLTEIDTILSAWPADLVTRVNLSATRQTSLTAVTLQAQQLRRTLANVGAASQQLAQLGDAALDSTLQWELTLLAQEATWQLRALARQASRRWYLEPDTAYPDQLKTWLERVDTLMMDINSAAVA